MSVFQTCQCFNLHKNNNKPCDEHNICCNCHAIEAQMKHMHKKHNKPTMKSCRNYCGVKSYTGKFLVHSEHRASHRLDMEIDRRHHYPQVSRCVESNLWVLTNQTIYLSNEDQRKTNNRVEKRVKEILSIQISAT